MERKFVANKAVLVNPQGKLLLVRDTGGTDHAGAAGRWDFPGGRMEPNETPLEGLVREIREEVGLEIDPAKVRPFHVDLWGKPDGPIVGMFYIVPVGTVEIKLSAEHDEFKWIDPRQPIELNGTVATSALKAYRQCEGIVVASGVEKGRQGYGCVQVFTGNGKGKTTASLGEAIRAIGAGKSVGIVYFDKGGNTHYSERRLLDEYKKPDARSQMPGALSYVATGRDRIDPATNRFDFSITNADRVEAKRGLEAARMFFREGRDVVVLDELNSTTDLGMLAVDDALALIAEKPENTELIITGRNAPQAILDRADLVTEMRLRKHYFYSGVQAREGLDY